jgi:hypothetical protein
VQLASCFVKIRVPRAAYVRVRFVSVHDFFLQYIQLHKPRMLNSFIKIVVILSIAVVGVLGLRDSHVAHAQTVNDPQSLFKDPSDSKRPTIVLPNPIDRFGGHSEINDVFKELQKFLLIIGGLSAFVVALYGGFKYLTSAGNPQAAEQGKRIVISAVAGVLIISLAFVLVRYTIEFISSALKL